MTDTEAYDKPSRQQLRADARFASAIDDLNLLDPAGMDIVLPSERSEDPWEERFE